MSGIHRILEKYWGYTSFRSLQEEIIRSVLEEKRDTIALLPTGGGKSICFQVPAMALEGLCLVISPLIALMEDQVKALNARDIKAFNLSGKISYRELDKILELCTTGQVKFLYLSPERLSTILVRERLKRMPVNLVAVDEAHCISQWGYDFRPSYRKIATVREILPGVPFIALTASANDRVIQDIGKQLQLKEPAIFKKSFLRSNLGIFVIQTEKKAEYLLKVVTKNKGTGLVYVQSRKETKTASDFLRQNGIHADFYHAGLSPEQRTLKQSQWLRGELPVMVCTNAFGMGIDKPDVRFVVHMGMPSSLENYYQEAGRAGRDAKKSFAIALVAPGDVDKLDGSIAEAFPPKSFIKRVYSGLGNYYRLAYGAGENVFYDLDLDAFSKTLKAKAREVFHALQILKQDGLIHLTEAFYQPSRITFLLGSMKLYEFQVFNPTWEPLIKLLLRTYSGVFDDFVRIDEPQLARKLGWSPDQVVKALLHLHQLQVIEYIPKTDKPQVAFATERLSEDNFHISPEAYEHRRSVMEMQVSAVKDFVMAKHCRFISICRYFDEKDTAPCGQCDNCLRNTDAGNGGKMSQLTVEIMSVLNKNKLSLAGLKKLKPFTILPAETDQAVRWLLDHGQLKLDDDQLLNPSGNAM